MYICDEKDNVQIFTVIGVNVKNKKHDNIGVKNLNNTTNIKSLICENIIKSCFQNQVARKFKF